MQSLGGNGRNIGGPALGGERQGEGSMPLSGVIIDSRLQ